MIAPGKNEWNETRLDIKYGLSGDFDITAEFEMLKLDRAVDGQYSGVYLPIVLNNKNRDMMRTDSVHYSGGNVQVFGMWATKTEDGKPKYSVPNRLSINPQATRVSKLRIVRRKNRAYMLFADQTGEWQLATQQPVTGEDIMINSGIRLMLHTGGEDKVTEVLWKSLNIRADRLIGMD